MCYKNLSPHACGHHALGPLHPCDLAAANVFPNRHCRKHWRVRRANNVLPRECPACGERKGVSIAAVEGEEGDVESETDGGGDGAVKSVQEEDGEESDDREGQQAGEAGKGKGAIDSCVLEVDGKVYGLPPRPEEVDGENETTGRREVVEWTELEGCGGNGGLTEEAPGDGEVEAGRPDDVEVADAAGGESDAPADDGGHVSVAGGASEAVKEEDSGMKTAAEAGNERDDKGKWWWPW